MLNELNQSGANLELGKYFHHAGSLHVYDRHYEMVDSISEGIYDFSESRFVLNSDFNLSNCMSLPGTDLSKSEIREYTDHCMGILFHV